MRRFNSNVLRGQVPSFVRSRLVAMDARPPMPHFLSTNLVALQNLLPVPFPIWLVVLARGLVMNCIVSGLGPLPRESPRCTPTLPTLPTYMRYRRRSKRSALFLGPSLTLGSWAVAGHEGGDHEVASAAVPPPSTHPAFAFSAPRYTDTESTPFSDPAGQNGCMDVPGKAVRGFHVGGSGSDVAF